MSEQYNGERLENAAFQNAQCYYGRCVFFSRCWIPTKLNNILMSFYALTCDRHTRWSTCTCACNHQHPEVNFMKSLRDLADSRKWTLWTRGRVQNCHSQQMYSTVHMAHPECIPIFGTVIDETVLSAKKVCTYKHNYVVHCPCEQRNLRRLWCPESYHRITVELVWICGWHWTPRQIHLFGLARLSEAISLTVRSLMFIVTCSYYPCHYLWQHIRCISFGRIHNTRSCTTTSLYTKRNEQKTEYVYDTNCSVFSAFAYITFSLFMFEHHLWQPDAPLNLTFFAVLLLNCINFERTWILFSSQNSRSVCINI